MAINTLATATLFQETLDKVAMHEALTGWMEANAGDVIYNGGAEIKIPKMSLQGLGDYDRDNGYTQGSVTLEYETRKMTQDRGRKFSLDAVDVDETNFVATASTVMGEFQRVHVVPEIDAYRLSKIATDVIAASKAGMIEYGYTPAESTILRKMKTGIKKIRDAGYNGDLIIHATGDVMLELEMFLSTKMQTATISIGGIDLTVPAIDKCAIIETPQNRMYTSIKMNDGKTAGQEVGGYAKGATAKDINFMIIPKPGAIAVSKQDKMRIFDPNTNQKADAWAMDYRRFHDVWTKDNTLPLIYLNIKDAA